MWSLDLNNYRRMRSRSLLHRMQLCLHLPHECFQALNLSVCRIRCAGWWSVHVLFLARHERQECVPRYHSVRLFIVLLDDDDRTPTVAIVFGLFKRTHIFRRSWFFASNENGMSCIARADICTSSPPEPMGVERRSPSPRSNLLYRSSTICCCNRLPFALHDCVFIMRLP